MINVTEQVKNAYDMSTTSIDKIILDNKEYRVTNVNYDDDCYEKGNIFGTAIAKSLEFEIENSIDLEKKEFEYLTGIEVQGQIAWISLGKFITIDTEPNDTTNILKVTAMDYMLKSNVEYHSKLDYSSNEVTMLDVANEACELAGLELGTLNFTNNNFIVDSNQFEENTIVRQVLQAIAQMSGTVAKIKNDNKLYFINPNQNTTIQKVFTLNNYIEADIKRQTHPINVVSIGMANVEGENVTLRDEESIERLGEENTLAFNDNPFAYTQAKREQLITALFNAIKGFEYKAYAFDCPALPYIETMDKVQFKDRSGNTYDSFVFRFNYKSPKSLESTMEAPSIIKATVEYQNSPNAMDVAKHTEFMLDKANQKMILIAKEQTAQSQRITNVEGKADTTAANLSTFINTTYAQDIANIQQQIDGAIQFWNGAAIPTLNNYPANQWTTEADRVNHQADIYTVIEDVEGELKQGKSYRFDKVNNVWQWIELTDNEVSAVQALANSKAKVYVVTPIPPYNVGDLWLKDQELYECIRAKDNAGTFSQSDWQKATKYTDDTKANEVDEKLTTTNQKVATIELNLESITETVEQTSTGLREVKEELDAEDSFTRQKSIQIEAAEATLDDVYMYGELEQDGNPTPDNPIEIEIVGNNVNLFDKDNAKVLNAYITSSSNTIVSNKNSTLFYIPIVPNKDVCVSRQLIGKRFNIGETSELPTIGGPISNVNGTLSDCLDEYKTITTSSTAKYLVVFYSNVGGDNLINNNGYTEEELRNSIKVEYGTMPTGYTNCNRGGIDYKVTGDSEKKVTVELPENEFLANIGEYEDYIDSTGLLHKVIGKVVLDGSDDESLPLNSRLTNTLRFDLPILTDGKLINANKVVCNRFTSVYGNTNDYEHCRNSSSSYPTSFIFYINKSRLDGYDDSLTAAQVSELVRVWLKENPLEIYYILETPYNALLEENEIKKYLALPTIKGTNNIEITAPTSATYKRDTELNAVYAKRKYVDEKFAQQEITNESITNTVSSSQILIANNTNSIDEVNNAIAGLNGSTTQIQEDLEATKQELSTQLQQTNTSFQASINEINTTLANGIASTSVKTTTGTFDNEGLHIKKSDSEMESLLNNEGLYVNKGNQNQLTCDKDGVITENLYVRTYLTAGYHRTEGFIENGEKRTGVFYQGGVE